MTWLAEHLGQPRSTASAIAKRLEERGLLTRRRRADDKRRLAIELTDTGRNEVASSVRARSDSHETAFEGLEPQEWRMLLQLGAEAANQVSGPAPPQLIEHTPAVAGPISASGISMRDLGNEAVAGLFARPGRMALTVLGTVIGLSALVATLGLSRTASNRIIGRFDELAATEVVVS
ncbi:MAG: winged helix-turn-helix transcriptional regulator, partial [Actinomycetia bacterium]|nr:winged helix-turn-helix transcriptional regulator [Actinomycetes bacterium]